MVFYVGKWGVPISPSSDSVPQGVPQPTPAPIKLDPSPAPKTSFSSIPPTKKNEVEPFADWTILGFFFTLGIVVLFLLAGVVDVNLAYSLKYFFQYIVLALTVAMLIAGIIEWFAYKKRKVGYFSIGMVLCIIIIMAIVLASSFVPQLLPVSNAILANDGPFTKETAQIEFNNMKNSFSELANNSTPSIGLRAIYAESSSAGLRDVVFFQSRLDDASFGPTSGETIFALVTASRTSLHSMSVAISKIGEIDSLLTKNQLASSIWNNAENKALINSVVIKSVAIDESKLGEINPDLAGKYPISFWQNSKKQIVIYLAEYMSYKKQSLQASLDSNNYLAAFIEANQLAELEKDYGK